MRRVAVTGMGAISALGHDWASISARLKDSVGRQVETWQEIEVVREIAPVAPYLYFAIPEALRGGFNAAWIPFGGEWTDDTPKSVRNDTLRDNLVFPGLHENYLATYLWWGGGSPL